MPKQLGYKEGVVHGVLIVIWLSIIAVVALVHQSDKASAAAYAAGKAGCHEQAR